MYIKGKAGCGKSVLAAHLVEFFKSRGMSTYFYYFNAIEGDQTSEIHFVRTLLFQYMEEHDHAEALTDQLYPLFLKSPKSVASKTSELWTALKQTTSEIEQPVYWIIDGIDECEERAHRLIPVLMNIAEKTPHLRVIFLGQPDNHVDEVLLDKVVSVYITPQMVELDIRTFVLAEIQNSSILGLPTLRDNIVSTLLDGSESMFLWVKLMLDDLKQSITKSDAERRLQTLPRGLSNAYARRLDRLAQSDSGELKLSQTIFSFLSVACRPLDLEEFRYAYAMSLSSSLDQDNLIFESQMKRIITRTAGLVEVGYDDKLRLVHSSLRDYLQRPESYWATQPKCRVFRVGKRKAHCVLGTSCLDFLDTDEIYRTDLHLQGVSNQQPQGQPFIAYASSYMPYHLLQARNPSELIGAKLNDFEESGNLINWAEYCLASGLHGGLGESAEIFSSAVNLHGSEDLKRMASSDAAVDILVRAAERRTNIYGSEDPRTLRLLVLLEMVKSSDSKAAEHTRDQQPQLPHSHRSNIAVLRRSMVTFERALQNVRNDWIDQSNLLPGALLFLSRSLTVGEAMQATLRRLAHMVLNAAASLPFAIVWPVGMFYEQMGRYEEAEQLFRIAIKKAETVWGANCQTVLRMMDYMGYFMASRRESYTEALEWYQRALDGYEKVLGKDHADTLNTIHNMASVFNDQGQYEKALEWYQRALDGYEKVLGKDDADTLNTIHNMAIVFKNQRLYEKALEWYQRALDGYEKVLGKDHADTLNTIHNMAVVFDDRGQYEKALEWYQRALDGYEKVLGKDHASTLNTIHNMAVVFDDQGQYENALEWYQRALDGREKMLGKDHVDTLHTIHNMAIIFRNQRQYEKALEWYQRACDGYEKAYGTEHTYTVGAAYQVKKLLGKQGMSYVG